MNVIYFDSKNVKTNSIQYKKLLEDNKIFEYYNQNNWFILFDEKYFRDDLNYDCSIFQNSFLIRFPDYEGGDLQKLWNHFLNYKGYYDTLEKYHNNEFYKTLPK